MADHAVTLVVAAFATSDAATTAFKQLKDGGSVKVQDVALAEKKTDGASTSKESMGGAKT